MQERQVGSHNARTFSLRARSLVKPHFHFHFWLLGSRLCAGSAAPNLQWDPETIDSCVEWYDNDEGETCESVRKSFAITPEEFTAWNPSVGLNCKPWRWQSYCIVTKEKLATAPPKPRTAQPTTTTPTPTTATLGPSPAAWTHLGCYVDNDTTSPVLEKRVSKEGGDAALTIPKCEDTCYRAQFEFAGVKEGNECCGDKTKMCGSKDPINVLAPDWETTSEVNEETSTEADATTKVESEVVSGSTEVDGTVVSAHSSCSGGMRYHALFRW
ncbi:WSC domain protein [Fusarium solani]|uniref:WSC domain protein n=1 Tax=Fusarium solani TaxID=169388 RepID=A0A9P9JYB7_FUSSL|nr:WSC domain protein [Fusarium solani]KAH7237165.1 WSC domain protein [Fusarium solani]